MAGNDEYTKLLLHGDGNLNDDSGSDHTISISGDAGTTTALQKFGTGCIYNLGNAAGSNYLYSAVSPDWQFGADDFTIDLWVYHVNKSGDDTYLWYGGSSGNGWHLDHVSGQLRLICYKSGSVGGGSWGTTWSPDNNVWYHIAAVRYGDVCTLYINGAQHDSDALTGTIDSPDSSLHFGMRPVNWDRGFNGYYDEIRISKGIARWTEPFADNLPDAPYSSGPDYALVGNLPEASRLIAVSGDNYTTVHTEELSAGNFNVGVDYGKKIVLMRKNDGQLEGFGNIMPTAV